MRCAASVVTTRLTDLRAHVVADKPPFNYLIAISGVAGSAEGNAGYSWFQPFTVLTDGVSLQEKRLRLASEGSCDATPEMLEAIRAKRAEQQSCTSSKARAALNSPKGLAAYARCDDLVGPSLPGCILADGSGSGCQGDPERVKLPYLLRPKNQEWTRGGAAKLHAIDATLTGVSTLEADLDSAESRYADSDRAAQSMIAASIPNLQVAFNRERALLDTEKARLDQERRDVDVLTAEIVRQQQAVTRHTRDKERANKAIGDSQLELQEADALFNQTQTGASTALLKAENAFIDDQTKGRNCHGSGSDCAIAIEADFNRSSASVEAFRNGQIALRDLNAARLNVVRLATVVMAERLALVQVSTQLAQTQTLLAFNKDQHAKRTEHLQRDQRHLDNLVADSEQDWLRFGLAVSTNTALTAAPSQSCSGP